MSLDVENSMQLEVIKSEQDPLKKFRLYFDYLKDKYKNINGTIRLIKTEDLGQDEMNFFKGFISFLKTLNSDNCDVKAISTKIDNFLNNLNNCSEKNFINWMRNLFQPFELLRGRATDWDGNGDREDGINFLINETLLQINPDNIF